MRRPVRVLAAVLVMLLSLSTPAAGVQPAPQRIAAAADGAAGQVSVRPVDGPVVRRFSAPSHPFGPGHRGVDLQARPGEPVRSARSGLVVFAGTVAGISWVTVDHGAGLSTTYGDVVASVEAGAVLRAGDVLGSLAGGASHLDWGARVDRISGRHRYVDPLLLLVELRPVLVAGLRRGLAAPVDV